MRLIMAKGHSRIPVYAGEKNNIIGLLLVRKLHQNQIIDIIVESNEFPLVTLLL
jgi:CBS domain containing-hemolysin-like protein